MSDKAAVNDCFFRKFYEYRKGIISTESYENNEHNDLTKCHCLMHFEINLKNQADQALIMYENNNTENSSQTSSKIFRNLYAVANALTVNASDKYSLTNIFHMLCKNQDRGVKFLRLMGNREMCYFENSFCLYTHLKNSQLIELCDFIDEKSNTNNGEVKKKILEVAQCPRLFAGVRALAIFFIYIMCPLLYNRLSSNLLEAIVKLMDMHDKLNIYSRNAHDLNVGLIDIPKVDATMNCEEIKKCLFDGINPEVEKYTKEALELICAKSYTYSMSYNADYIELELSKLSTKQLEILKTCPSDNALSERTFSHVDREVNEKPSASISHLETKVVFKENKVHNKLIEEYSTNPNFDELQKKIKNLSKQRTKILKDAYQSELSEFKKECLKKRKKSTMPVEKTSVISESSRKKNLDKLKKKLLSDKEAELKEKKARAQAKIATSAHTAEYAIPTDIRSLVGKKCKHQWEEDGKIVWYYGKIIEIKEEDKTNNLKTKYTIVYLLPEGLENNEEIYDTENPSVYCLLEDMKRGELKLINKFQ